jgi:hypothetical protein
MPPSYTKDVPWGKQHRAQYFQEPCDPCDTLNTSSCFSSVSHVAAAAGRSWPSVAATLGFMKTSQQTPLPRLQDQTCKRSCSSNLISKSKLQSAQGINGSALCKSLLWTGYMPNKLYDYKARKMVPWNVSVHIWIQIHWIHKQYFKCRRNDTETEEWNILVTRSMYIMMKMFPSHVYQVFSEGLWFSIYLNEIIDKLILKVLINEYHYSDIYEYD